MGLPEARITLTEATIYLATAPKSKYSVEAIEKAMSAVKQLHKITVPAHLADSSHSQAPALLGKGQGYKYPHSYGGYVGQTYLPAEAAGIKLYQPGENGYELKIRQFLQKLPVAKDRPPQK